MKFNISKNKYWDPPDIAWNKFQQPVMIMMCGLPGCGKTSVAKKISEKYGYVVYSSDEIRKKLYGDTNDQNHNTEVFEELHKCIIQDLKAGKNVIYDATNISSKRRRHFLSMLNKIDCCKVCYFIPTPYKQCLKNNRKRGRVVPENVIKSMYKRFNVPNRNEGFDWVEVDYSGIPIKSCSEKSVIKLFKHLCRVKQDNPHHSMTIGEHCLKTYDLLCSKYDTANTVAVAGLFHDIGKEFCKSFINSKGEKTNVAHYYGHENVSAYMVFQYLDPEIRPDIVGIAFLINNHMKLMGIEQLPEDKQKEKKRALRFKMGSFGCLMSPLEDLYKADKAAA